MMRVNDKDVEHGALAVAGPGSGSVSDLGVNQGLGKMLGCSVDKEFVDANAERYIKLRPEHCCSFRETSHEPNSTFPCRPFYDLRRALPPFEFLVGARAVP
jgi:hypothetical protein